MQRTEPTLQTAIDELRCLSADSPATLAELHALGIAQRCVRELVHSCVEQLRETSASETPWADIAEVLGAGSANAVRKRFATPAVGADA